MVSCLTSYPRCQCVYGILLIIYVYQADSHKNFGLITKVKRLYSANYQIFSRIALRCTWAALRILVDQAGSVRLVDFTGGFSGK